MKTRPYQIAAIEAAEREWKTVTTTLVQMPTGMGKTVVIAEVCRRAPLRAVVLAHLDDLVQEASRKIQRWTTLSSAIEMGNSWSPENSWDPPRVVVSSVQSLSRENRLERFNPAKFSTLIIDEGHHALGKMYRRVMDHFTQNPDLKILLVTATPKRTDKLSLGQVAQSVAYCMTIEDAVNDGWLVEPEQHIVPIVGLDYSKLRTVANDFRVEDLEDLVCQAGPLQGMAGATVELCGDEPTIVFCVSVKHAHMASEIINSYKPGSAIFLAGEESYKQLGLPTVSKEDRRRLLDDYRAGRMQFLCLCNLGLEGFDAPITVNVAMWRATKSLTLYTQAFGRGTRPAESIADQLGDVPTAEGRRAMIAASPKPKMRMLDFKGEAGEHNICDLTDLLGGKFGFPVRKHAKDLLATEQKPMRPNEALERAMAELALLEYVSAERKKREAIAQGIKVQYTTEQVDPFGQGSSAPTMQASAASLEPPTEKQIWKLCSLGVTEKRARSYSKRQASVVIDRLLKKQERGHADAL